MPTKLQKDAEFYLKDNGFELRRETRHGMLWEDGISTIMVPKSPTCRGERNLWADIRRAMKLREQAKSQLLAVPEPVQNQEITKVVKRIPVQEPAVVAAPEPAKEEEPMNETKPNAFITKPASQPAPQPREKKMPLIVMTILTDPELSDTQKVKMLMAYIDL